MTAKGSSVLNFWNLANSSYYGLYCPYLRLSSSPDVPGSILNWLFDPEYSLFYGCRCSEVEDIKITLSFGMSHLRNLLPLSDMHESITTSYQALTPMGIRIGQGLVTLRGVRYGLPVITCVDPPEPPEAPIYQRMPWIWALVATAVCGVLIAAAWCEAACLPT